MEQGPNVDDTAALAQAVPLPILASGGVGRVALPDAMAAGRG